MGRKGRGEGWDDDWPVVENPELERLSGLNLVEEGETGSEVPDSRGRDGQDATVRRPKTTAQDPWHKVRLGSVRDVARVFGVHWKTVEKWRLREGLPCIRVGGVIRYPLSDVLRWASARRVGA